MKKYFKNPFKDLDCEILTHAMLKFIEVFDDCFEVHLFDKLSLPGISEEIMWSVWLQNIVI